MVFKRENLNCFSHFDIFIYVKRISLTSLTQMPQRNHSRKATFECKRNDDENSTRASRSNTGTAALEAFASRSREKRDSNDVKRILDSFVTRVLEDEEDEEDRLNSTSEKLIESTSFRLPGKKPKGEWFQVDTILPPHRISQLETKIDAEFRSLQFRKQYLAAAIVDTSNALNASSSIEHFDTAVEPALSDIYSLNRDDDDVMVESLRSHHNLQGRIAVFVLGPSAAGKTYLTRRNLSQVLRTNHLFETSTKDEPPQAFVSIDGGLIRDVSKMWRFMSALPRYMNVGRRSDLDPVLGFSDLFSEYFKKRTGDFKLRLFRSLLRKGINMIIPDTAADCLLGVRRVRARSVRAGSARILLS